MVQLECVYFESSIVNGIIQATLYSFALDEPPGRKLNERPRKNNTNT